MKVLELFSGIGGMHYSLKESGVEHEVVEAFDVSTVANHVYRHNFPHTPLNVQGIESLSVKCLEDVTMVTMSPPCQPFTRMGKKMDDLDPRSRPFLHILDLLSQVKSCPAYLLMENVKGFEDSCTHDKFIQVLESCGYQYQEFLLTPLQFGVPNSRLRYYLIASQSPFSFRTSQTIMKDLPRVFRRNRICYSHKKPPTICSYGQSCTDPTVQHFKISHLDIDSVSSHHEHTDSIYKDIHIEEKTQILSICHGPCSTKSNNTVSNQHHISIQEQVPTTESSSTVSNQQVSIQEQTPTPESSSTVSNQQVSIQEQTPTTESSSTVSNQRVSIQEQTPTPESSSIVSNQQVSIQEQTPTPESSSTVSNQQVSIQEQTPVSKSTSAVSNQCYIPTQKKTTVGNIGPITPLTVSVCEWHTDCRTIGDYLEEESPEFFKPYFLPDSSLMRLAAMDVVTPLSLRCTCFTKSYGRFTKGAGSVLQTNLYVGMDTEEMKEVLLRCEDKQPSEEDMFYLRMLGLRHFTPQEVANLHCFPRTFAFPDRTTTLQKYRLLGNSLNIHVVSEVMKLLLKHHPC